MKPGATVSCALIGVLGCASSFYPPLDRLLVIALLAAAALAVLYGAAWWIVGEVLIWWGCVRPNPRPTHREPVFWPCEDEAA